VGKALAGSVVAVPTGQRFVVIDLDLQHEDAQRWYDDNRCRLPLTRAHVTRSSGRHLLFRLHPEVKCSAGKIAPHIDTRGIGGYIVWWPAHGYEVLHADHLAEVPEFLRAALMPPPPQERPARTEGTIPRLRERFLLQKIDGLVGFAAAAPVGTRDSSTFWTACRLCELVGENKLAHSAAEDLVISAAVANGLGASVGRTKFRSARRIILGASNA
jgi:Bifunctional DNA primase/polymerase, N-terminal